MRNTTHQQHRRLPWNLLAIAAAAILVLIAGAVATGILTTPAQRSAGLTGTDLNGRTVTLDGATPDPAASPIESTGTRLIVPAAGLNVRLGAMSMAHGQITPPGFASAYWVRNLGTTPATPDKGTVFVVMHALRGGGKGPGNYLEDETTGTPTVHAGDAVTVGPTTYTVTGWHTVNKTRIGADNTVWATAPGRLVLITCLEKPDGSPSTKNLVIEARRSN